AAVAAQALQDYHVICRKTSYRMAIDAGFVDPTLDAKRFSAPTEHFRHKRKTIESTVSVKCGQYLTCRSNRDPVSDKQPFRVHRRLMIARHPTKIASGKLSAYINMHLKQLDLIVINN